MLKFTSAWPRRRAAGRYPWRRAVRLTVRFADSRQAPANADGSVHDAKPDEAPEVTFVDEETFWATF